MHRGFGSSGRTFMYECLHSLDKTKRFVLSVNLSSYFYVFLLYFVYLQRKQAPTTARCAYWLPGWLTVCVLLLSYRSTVNAVASRSPTATSATTTTTSMVMTVFTHCVDLLEVGVYFCPLLLVFSSTFEYAGPRACIMRWSVRQT